MASDFMKFHTSVSSENARAGLKPDPSPAEHQTPMLGEGFTTPDNIQKKELFS
jgi:hypothetical protein